MVRSSQPSARRGLGLRACLLATTIAVSWACALTAAAPAPAAGTPPRTGLEPLLEIGIPGAQVNVDGRTAAAGVANTESGRRMRPDLAFRVGSVTKSFTATVVLQHVAERRLRLDDTVERWLPGLLPYGREVTIRNLLGHTSGIPDYWEAGPDPLNISFVNDPAARTRTWTPREIVARVAGEPQAFPAGSRVEYSNTNYTLLGMIVERATGRTLQQEITRRLIAPLRLRATRFPVTETALPRPFTRGYSFRFDADANPVEGPPIDVTEYNPSALWAMGNMVSTTKDLRRFYRALLGGRLLPPALTALMKETRPNQTEGWPVGIGFGLGIWSWDLPCGQRVYGHEGEVPESNTFAFGTEDGRRVIVMQHNQFYLNWDRLFDTIIPTYFSFWCDGRPRSA